MNYLLMIVHLVVLTSPLYSMDFFVSMKRYLTCPHQKIETAERFVHEFPLMILKNVQFRYQRCSAATQKKIDKHFSEDENKQLSAIFFLATKCYEPKIRKDILLEAAADKFLRLSVGKFYILYQWAHDVHDGKAGIPSSFNMKSVDLIFRFSDEIKRAAVLVDNNSKGQLYVGREDIKTLRTIIDNSKVGTNVFMGQNFKHRYYKKYSKDDLIDSLIPTSITSGCFYVVLAPIGLSRLIENYCCSKIDTSLPEKIKELTELIHLSEKLSLLDAVRTPADNITYSFIDRCKINIPFLSVIPGIGCLLYFLDGKMSFEDRLFFGGVTVLSFLLSYLPFERLPGGFLGLCCAIPIILFSIFSAIDYKRHCSWQHQDINWNGIDNVLKRQDLVIPEESRVMD